MLPTAFRSFRAGSQLARSFLPAGVDSLCDPLQRLVDPERLIYYSQTNTIYSNPISSPVAGWAFSCTNQRAETGLCTYSEQSGTPPRLSSNVQFHQRRWRTDQPAVKSDDIVIYEGPLKQAVLSLKKLSLFSCAATFAMSPVMLLFDTSATSLGAKASIAVTLCSFGIFTTGLLHWFTSPYVRRLVYDRKSETMEIETLSVFAKPQITRAHLAEVAYPDTIRPQVTFAVKKKFFYLDADRFPDKALLAALTPPEPSAAGTIPH